MKTDENWLACDHCDSEYRVVSSLSNKNPIAFCPFCGSENEDEFSDFEDDDQ